MLVLRPSWFMAPSLARNVFLQNPARYNLPPLPLVWKTLSLTVEPEKRASGMDARFGFVFGFLGLFSLHICDPAVFIWVGFSVFNFWLLVPYIRS